MNDVSMRDWQRRTLQWLAGKMFERSTPVGPYLVTPDEVGDAKDLEVRTEVDGVVMQQSWTSDLLSSPAEIIAYASQAITLRPGDLIATGTPGGVGDARKPPVYLHPGSTLRTWIENLGECLNPASPTRSYLRSLPPARLATSAAWLWRRTAIQGVCVPRVALRTCLKLTPSPARALQNIQIYHNIYCFVRCH